MQIRLADNFFKSPPKNGKYYVIAIDGRGGSGKTALVEYLATILPDFTFINGDDYFEPTQNTVAWGAFNDKRFNHDVIGPIKSGEATILYKPYDWHKEPHILEQQLTVNRGVCLERCFSFSFDLDWDLKIWVETPASVALQRGLDRDKELGDAAKKAWEELWQPKEDEYINSHRPQESADVVVYGAKDFQEQLE